MTVAGCMPQLSATQRINGYVKKSEAETSVLFELIAIGMNAKAY